MEKFEHQYGKSVACVPKIFMVSNNFDKQKACNIPRIERKSKGCGRGQTGASEDVS